MKHLISILLLILLTISLKAETGHDLWLRNKTSNPVNITCKKNSPTLDIARKELQQGWLGESGASVSLIIKKNKAIEGDGFKISKNCIEANTEKGILYGVYELLRRQQTGEPITDEVCNPSFEKRILNHWDNLNGTIERGYAGLSIFWRKGDSALIVTEQDKALWKEYARANASLGINGSVLNNVNASPNMLTRQILYRVKDIAETLRPYGIQTYLSIKYIKKNFLISTS